MKGAFYWQVRQKKSKAAHAARAGIARAAEADAGGDSPPFSRGGPLSRCSAVPWTTLSAGLAARFPGIPLESTAWTARGSRALGSRVDTVPSR